MYIKNLNKKGIMVIALAAGLCFIMIVFVSLTERIRNEAALTNRVGLNERLNQLACAVGRISIRKLQREIEMQDNVYVNELVNVRILENQEYGDITNSAANTEFSTAINDMAIIKKLQADFEKKFGKDNKLKPFAIKYTVNLGKDGQVITPAINGGSSYGVEENKCERKGYVEMAVTAEVEKSGLKRTYKVRKDFIFARLIAPPFYRFTLFSHNGAAIPDKTANGVGYLETGEVTTNDSNQTNYPLVCINRLISQKNMPVEKDDVTTTEGRNAVANKIKKDGFIKNGWIYLGGDGKSTDMRLDSGKLILNIVAGLGDDDFKSKFGEFFHFYYEKDSAGWLKEKNWSQWLADNVQGNSGGQCSMVFVDYGLFKGLLNIEYSPRIMGSGQYYLFKDKVASLYEDKTHNGATLENGSAMHLFGTPKHCIPTVVFGNVQRRYLKCFGLYCQFNDNNAYVLPLRVATSRGCGATNDTGPTTLYALYNGNIPYWYLKQKMERGAPLDEYAIGRAFVENFYGAEVGTAQQKELYNKSFETFYNGSDNPELCGIGPRITDEEPYMKGLLHIGAPSEADPKWNTAVAATKYCKNKPEELCSDDFTFEKNDADIPYYGSIKNITIDYDKYLLEQTSYTLSGENGQALKMTDKFMEDHFFADGEFSLGQIIRVEGDLNIDTDLYVSRGGIIVCTGRIDINKPIINKYVEDGEDSSDPSNFGLLTLIAQNGIYINNYKTDGDFNNLHAYLIAGCTGDSQSAVTVSNGNSKRLRIVGGVAADNIESLIKTGTIVEWGFRTGDLDKINKPNFYGLALGPRDIEIYTGD